MRDDIRILYVDMPIGFKAFVMAEDGFYTIYLNSRYCMEQNMKSLEHELIHIRNGDYDKQCSVDLLEFFSHDGNMNESYNGLQ